MEAKEKNEEFKEPKAQIVRDIEQDVEDNIDDEIEDEWEDDGIGTVIIDETDEIVDKITDDNFLDDADKKISEVVDDERFKKAVKQRKKIENDQSKSIKKDNRRTRFIRMKNNLKLIDGSGLYNVLLAISGYLDYLFNAVTLSSILAGVGLGIYFMINEKWEMSLVAICFSIAMTFINDKITK